MSDDIINDSVHDMLAHSQVKLGDAMAKQYDKMMLDKLFPLRTTCSHCGISLSFHMFKSSEMDHPFMKDNLDYLKWKYEQKQGLTSEPKGDIISFDHANPDKDIK